MLGAGIRLGEAIASRDPVGTVAGGKLADKLSSIENRLSQMQGGVPIHSPSPVLQNEANAALRNELKGWMEQSVTARMAEVESHLRAESERSQQQMLDAFVESIQTRVINRITQLEEEVATQSSAMHELRECSLRTERSVQKLLGGLDKLIVRNTSEPASRQTSGETHPEPAAESTHRAEVRKNEANDEPARSPRWRLFT